MSASLAFQVQEQDGEILALAPCLGLFSPTLGQGARLEPGLVVGRIRRLGLWTDVVVPPRTHGQLWLDRKGDRAWPVAYGEPLFRVRGQEAAQEDAEGAAADSHLVAVTTPIDGILYHRPSPDQPAFITVGAVLEPGATVALVEVMKTFHPVRFTGDEPARVAEIPSRDTSEVAAGDVIVTLERIS